MISNNWKFDQRGVFALVGGVAGGSAFLSETGNIISVAPWHLPDGDEHTGLVYFKCDLATGAPEEIRPALLDESGKRVWAAKFALTPHEVSRADVHRAMLDPSTDGQSDTSRVLAAVGRIGGKVSFQLLQGACKSNIGSLEALLLAEYGRRICFESPLPALANPKTGGAEL